MGKLLKNTKDWIEWASTGWTVVTWLGLAGSITGIAISIYWAIYAAVTGLPLPLTLAVTYCTVVGTVYLAMAPAAYRTVKRITRSVPSETASSSSHAPPDFTIWRHVETVTLQQAASLWCHQDPEDPAENRKVQAWVAALKDAIQRGEITPERRPGISADDYLWERRQPKDYSPVTRTELRKWAAKKGFDPEFLR